MSYRSQAEYWAAYGAYLQAWNQWAGVGSARSGYALEPVKTMHGFRYVDRNGHGGFEAVRRSNGAYAYLFPDKDLVPLLFGRGELWQAKNDLVDHNPFNKE